MEQEFIVRKGTEKDLENLCILEKEFDEFYESLGAGKQYGRLPFSEIEDQLHREEFTSSLLDKNSALFVAEKEGSIAGYGIVSKEKKDARMYKTSEVGHINSIYVTQKFRKLGVGKMLFEEMFSWLKSQGIDTCTLSVIKENTPALEMYKAMGFEIDKMRMYKKI